MLLPLVLQLANDATVQPHLMQDHAAMATHVTHIATNTFIAPLAELGAVVTHALAMFLVMAASALVVYEYVGLAVLRRAWFNLDRLWAGALIMVGVITMLVI